MRLTVIFIILRYDLGVGREPAKCQRRDDWGTGADRHHAGLREHQAAPAQARGGVLEGSRGPDAVVSGEIARFAFQEHSDLPKTCSRTRPRKIIWWTQRERPTVDRVDVRDKGDREDRGVKGLDLTAPA